jgi:hypothetical protein
MTAEKISACANADPCFPDLRLILSVCSCMGELFFSTIPNAAFATHSNCQRNLGGFILPAWAPDPPSGYYLGDILR